VPKSRLRKKAAFTPPTGRSAANLPSPRWVAPLMVAMFLLGLLWIVVFYVTRGDFPIGGLGNWNLAVGFAFIAVGFGISTQWR
jgi:hypothetical protein